MSAITLHPETVIGQIKRMHAVNNGPARSRIDNCDDYARAGIPYARNHDASYCEEYGNEHCVDVIGIFPDFDADPYDEASYDFAITDAYLRITLEAGTKIFYRLGNRIEHACKKYGTRPPKDFHKWAVICEHIIRHYNEGWANGFHWNIEYWEIWNEADLDHDDSDNKLCWGGTAEQFYEFYRIAALHLKKCFPQLKIGGPAAAWPQNPWLERFFAAMTEGERVPLDFYSWHTYCYEPEKVTDGAVFVRNQLDRWGYTETESICNEWNYIERFSGEEFRHSISVIIGMKGAAFTASVMTKSQNAPVDMLMYYDARPCIFNGLFDVYTLLPLKGYYPFYMWNELYRLGRQTEASSDDPDVDVVCASDGDAVCALVTYYSMDETADAKEVTVTGEGTYEVYTLDADHTNEKTAVVTLPTVLAMNANSVVMLKKV